MFSRRDISLILVGLLLFSGVGSAVGSAMVSGGDSSHSIDDSVYAPPPPPPGGNDGEKGEGGDDPGDGDDAGGVTDNQYPPNPIEKTLEDFKSNKSIPWGKVPNSKKEKIKGILKDMKKKQQEGGLNHGSRHKAIQEINKILIKELDGGYDNIDGDRTTAVVEIIQDHWKVGTKADGNYPKNPVEKSIEDFKSNPNIPWGKLSGSEKTKIKNSLKELEKKGDDRTPTDLHSTLFAISDVFEKSVDKDASAAKPERYHAISGILKDHFKTKGTMGYARGKDSPLPDINIPSIVYAQLEALKDEAIKAFNWLFKEIYSHTLGTPVPKNDGWHGVLGTPTNEPFKTQYSNLLTDTLYPVMNYLLGLGILFLGASLAVNPFLSRYRIWDLLTKFVAGLMFYAFSWTVVTLMHGMVGGITDFVVPNPNEITQSAGSLLGMGAAIPIAAQLGASVVGYGSVFGLGLLLGVRHFLLTTIFPYIFGPLILILYISPWQKLRAYASMALWQYVNVLTMVIPIAIVLRAAVAVQWSFGNAIGFVFTMIGSLLFLLAYPLASTYFFFRVGGSVARVARSGAMSVSSRVQSAKDKVWSNSNSANDTTATQGQSTGEQTQTTVNAELEHSGTTTSSSSWTTAKTVRTSFENASNDGDTMTPEEMKQYVEQHPKMTNLKDEVSI